MHLILGFVSTCKVVRLAAEDHLVEFKRYARARDDNVRVGGRRKEPLLAATGERGSFKSDENQG